MFFLNHLNVNLNNLNSHPPEVVSRYRDPQLQVGKNYKYLLNWRQNICKSLNIHFIYNITDLV